MQIMHISGSEVGICLYADFMSSRLKTSSGAPTPRANLAKRLVCNVANVSETARGNRFTAPNKGAVMEAGLAIVDQANFVDHLRRSARLEDGESLGVASLLLALNYSVSSQRSAPEVAVDIFASPRAAPTFIAFRDHIDTGPRSWLMTTSNYSLICENAWTHHLSLRISGSGAPCLSQRI